MEENSKLLREISMRRRSSDFTVFESIQERKVSKMPEFESQNFSLNSTAKGTKGVEAKVSKNYAEVRSDVLKTAVVVR